MKLFANDAKIYAVVPNTIDNSKYIQLLIGPISGKYYSISLNAIISTLENMILELNIQ